MQSISGQFKGKPSQMEFVCGHDFFQMFRQLWPDFIVFQPDLLSAHLENLGRELESDPNISRLATAHGLNTLAQRKNIYVEPSLFQVRGRLSRGATLFETSHLSQTFSGRELEEFSKAFRVLEDSLRVVDYLPPGFQKGRDRVQRGLRAWPARLKKDWSDAYSKTAIEARARREAPPGGIPLPRKAVRDLVGSHEYTYLTTVYAELDEEINEANTSVVADQDRFTILDDPSFANYASLLHAATTCFPVVQFARDGQINWSAEELLSGNRNLLITGPPGYGKTSFSRNHFLADLQRFRTGTVDILPLYFAAHAVEVNEGRSFNDMFIRHEVAARLQSDPSLRVRVYLDGLDEVRTGDQRDQILAIAKQACTGSDTRYHCVATAREHVGGYSTSWLTRVRLSLMSDETLRELVTAWLDGDPQLISRFYLELSYSEALLSVLRVPLLATLTVLVFKNLHRLPENKLRLYQMFIDLLLGGAPAAWSGSW